MKKSELKNLVKAITDNESLPIEERIEQVMNMRSEMTEEDEKANLRNDVVFFSMMIEMIEKDNGPHIYDGDLLMLYSMLLETYDNLNDYKPMKKVAYAVTELLRDEMTKWEDIEETVPEIIESMGDSVYNHALYEILLHYIRAAWKAGKLNEDLKGRVRKFLKLRILLDDNDHLDYRLIPNELKDAIAQLFTPQDLIKIIMHPEIGHLKKDPVEYTWEWENIYYDMEAKLEDRFANAPRHMGFCFKYWSAKQELLNEEYGIKWRSPSIMNPHVMFD